MENSKNKFRALYDGIQYFDKDIAKFCLHSNDHHLIPEVCITIASHRYNGIHDLIVELETVGINIDFFIGKLMEE